MGAAGSEARAVEVANTALYTAIEAGDLDLMHAVWLDGADAKDLVCVHPGWQPLHGRAEVLRSWAAIMANTPYVQFFLTDVEVRLRDTVAVVTCTENVLIGEEDYAGTAPFGFVAGKVATTNVFRRTDQGWRLWVHHSSPIAGDDADDELAIDLTEPLAQAGALDRIAVHGIGARGRHGVLPHERVEGQDFLIDVVLYVDTRAAAGSDSLADTVDYGAVAVAVADVVSGEPVDLIETLAQRIADRCLSDARVAVAEVTVHKPQAPVTVPFADVTLTIRRTRRSHL